MPKERQHAGGCAASMGTADEPEPMGLAFLRELWRAERGLWRGPWRQHPSTETREVATEDVTQHKVGARLNGVRAVPEPGATDVVSGVIVRVDVATPDGWAAAGAGKVRVREDRWHGIFEFL